MKSYLLDTNIVIYYLKGHPALKERLDAIPPERRFVSEITLAELKFGVANSANPAKNQTVLNNFLTGVAILPIFQSIDLYAAEKARLRKAGTPVDDFDLLIGVTGVTHNLIVVTNNTAHFKRIDSIVLENWIQPEG